MVFRKSFLSLNFNRFNLVETESSFVQLEKKEKSKIKDMDLNKNPNLPPPPPLVYSFGI